MKNKIIVKEQEISIIKDNYISLTDIARSKNSDEPKDVVKNWLRNKNSIEFLGLWKKINNPDFKEVEFDHFKNEAGLNSFTLSSIVVLANLESLNAEFIKQGLAPEKRVEKLNLIAIEQLELLIGIKKLKEKNAR